MSPGRKHSKKTAKEHEDDLETRSSESCSNRFGFVAYSVNSGEKSRIKIKTFGHQPAYSCASESDSDLPAAPSPCPASSPRKHRYVELPESDKHDRLEPHSKKRRAAEDKSNDTVHPLWLG